MRPGPRAQRSASGRRNRRPPTLPPGGFALPWRGDLLIRHSPVFACRLLSEVSSLSVGRIATHLVLRMGSWTLFHAIQTEARFPRVDGIIPAASFSGTKLRFAPADIQFLRSALDRLPGTDILNAPCTLDLNGRIAAHTGENDAPDRADPLAARTTTAPPCARLHQPRFHSAGGQQASPPWRLPIRRPPSRVGTATASTPGNRWTKRPRSRPTTTRSVWIPPGIETRSILRAPNPVRDNPCHGDLKRAAPRPSGLRTPLTCLLPTPPRARACPP